MQTIAKGMGLFLAVCVAGWIAIMLVSALSFLLITALQIGLILTGVFIAVHVGKKLFQKA